MEDIKKWHKAILNVVTAKELFNNGFCYCPYVPLYSAELIITDTRIYTYEEAIKNGNYYEKKI